MLDIMKQVMPNIMEKLPEFCQSIIETFIMLGVTGIVSMLLGTLFGVILVVTRKSDILENRIINLVLGKFIDFFRAIPFIILVTLLSGLTRLIAGSAIGLRGAIFPLIVGTIPFFARQVESALAEIDRGLIEASQAMGSSPMEIIVRVYLRESIPGIIRATCITLISLLGFITMVGAVGGGGVGDFCIRFGYNANQGDVTIVCVIILLLITSLIQAVGSIAIRKTTH